MRITSGKSHLYRPQFPKSYSRYHEPGAPRCIGGNCTPPRCADHRGRCLWPAGRTTSADAGKSMPGTYLSHFIDLKTASTRLASGIFGNTSTPCRDRRRSGTHYSLDAVADCHAHHIAVDRKWHHDTTADGTTQRIEISPRSGAWFA